LKQKIEIQEFNLGDEVQWGSQSQGSWKFKQGFIAQIVPPLIRPDATEWPQLFTGAGPGSARKSKSYIVKVGNRIYWPFASKLKMVRAKEAIA